MSAASESPPTMTVADFLAWNAAGERWELIDGIARAMPPARPRHAAILGELARLVGNHLAEQRPQCRVFIEAGVRPKVRASANVRVPDLAVTCAALEPDARLLPEPLLIVEILSPSNRAETWQNVWSYVTIPSAREILVLHSNEVRADLLRRNAEGAWPDDPETLASGDVLTLASLGFANPLAALYPTAT